MSDKHTSHTVRAGDWIGAIADTHALGHWSNVWDHPINAPLRELRKTPDHLMVGDEVRIPATPERGIDVASGTRVVFRVRSPDVLRLRLLELGPYVRLFGPMPYRLDVAGTEHSGTLCEENKLTIEVPLEPSVREVTLTLHDTYVRTFAVGGLGPVDEELGALTRLQNLGHASAQAPPAEAAGAESPQPDPPPQSVSDALCAPLRAFQRRHRLERTGRLDAPTRSKLHDEYGG